jgi:hypothetical protein
MSATEGNGFHGNRVFAAFGPFHPLPDLTDVQRRGMDSAAQVIEHLIGVLGSAPEPPPAEPDRGSALDEPDVPDLRRGVARALDLYTDLVRRSFESYADLMEQTLRARGVQLNATEEPRTDPLLIRCARAGRAAVTVWLHNTTTRPSSTVLRLTALTAHDGQVVPECAGSFTPVELSVGPGVSTSARLTLAPGDAAPGLYRGHVLAHGLPDTALPVRLLVTDVPPGPGS